MNNLWYSFREFKNNIIFKMIIIIQIIIAINLLYKVIEVEKYQNNKMASMEQITKNKKIYQFTSKYTSIDELLNAQNNPNKFNKLSQIIQEKFQLVTANYGEMNLKNFDGINQFRDKDFNNLDNNYTFVNSIQCSSNFFSLFDIKLSQGNLDKFEEFTKLNSYEKKEKYIPILLGNSYKRIFHLNDIIETKSLKYEIMGFIKANQFFLDKGIYDLSRVKNLNTFIIAPMPKDIIDANLNNAFLISNNEGDFNSIKKSIDDIVQKQEVKLSILDPNENIKFFLNTLKFDTNIKLIIIYIIVIFVAIGLLIIFSNRVAAMRKEFSLHIMHGATIKDICMRVILEHIFLVIISTIISLIFLINSNTKIINDILYFEPIVFTQTILIIFSIVLLIAMIPVYNIKKHRLNYLIRGE